MRSSQSGVTNEDALGGLSDSLRSEMWNFWGPFILHVPLVRRPGLCTGDGEVEGSGDSEDTPSSGVWLTSGVPQPCRGTHGQRCEAGLALWESVAM